MCLFMFVMYLFMFIHVVVYVCIVLVYVHSCTCVQTPDDPSKTDLMSRISKMGQPTLPRSEVCRRESSLQRAFVV